MQSATNYHDSSPQRQRGRPRSWNDKSAQNIIKSLDRALGVFEFLSKKQDITLSELAAKTNQSTATVYRILITLEARGFVEFDSKHQVWNIGAGAFMIGTRFLQRTSLVESARPILRKLMEETGETANLGIDKGGMVLCVSQVETEERIRAYFPQGSLSPMHASGIGKALLAHMDSDQFDRWFNNNKLTVFTNHTINCSTQLSAELQTIRVNGYAIDDEESNLGMRCYAAPVFDINKEAVAGLSISGPISRVGKEQQFVNQVMHAAENLSIAIGGRVNFE